jgi:hypothetical protein
MRAWACGQPSRTFCVDLRARKWVTGVIHFLVRNSEADTDVLCWTLSAADGGGA